MTARKPLVYNGGTIQQLQAGDYLENTLLLPQLSNAEASPITIGQPVYIYAADSVKLAKANATGTKDVIGLVGDASITNGTSGSIQMNGDLVAAATSSWDTIAGTSGGLTPNTKYYLSTATFGYLTATPPSTVGQYVCQVGIAISTTEMKIHITAPILL